MASMFEVEGTSVSSGLFRRHAMQWLIAAGLVMAGWLAPGLSPMAWAQTTTTCYAADSKGVDGPVDYGAYCWIDFSPLDLGDATSTFGQDFRVDLRGGAYLTFNLRITNQTPAGANMYAVDVPSWEGAAFGNSAFTDIPGNPILYQDENNQNGPRNTVTLSSLTLHANGATELPFVFVAADGESSNADESLVFSTTGEPWTLVSAPGISNPARNMPLLSPATAVGNSTGSQSIRIDGVVAGSGGGVGSYVFTTDNSPGTVTAELEGNGLQGAIFGLKYHTVGLSLTKTHVGDFKVGGTGTYIIEPANTVQTPEINPPTEPQPVRVVDTLPDGLTYVSADGSGFWGCTNAGQIVTCNANSLQDLTYSRAFPSITINVTVDSDAPSTVTNTAEISDPTTSTLVFNVCEVPGNNVCPGSATSTDGDLTTILHSDLSTSTKTVVDRNAGDANPGDVLEYTITLVESADVAASNVSVIDDMPANVGSLEVVDKPDGVTDNSSASGGANGTGRIDISGISVPAGGSVSIVYRVTIAAGTAPGTQIENDATITNGDPKGTGGAPEAPPVTVSQSAMPVSGNKQLYLLMGTPGEAHDLTRTRPGSNGTMTWRRNDGFQYFYLPPLAKPLVLNDNTISVTLRGRRSGGGGSRDVRVRMYLNGTGGGNAISGESSRMNFGAGYTSRVVDLDLGPASFAAGDQLILRVENEDNQDVELIQRDGSDYSFVTLDAATVINVDSIGFYSAQYPSTAQKPEWEPGDTVYIRADISDPFGGFDVSAANSTLTLADADGGPLILDGVAMTPRTSPVEGDEVPNRILEYAYTIPANPSFGSWTATVTGSEGLEDTIVHSRNASFEVMPKTADLSSSTKAVSDLNGGDVAPGDVLRYTITLTESAGVTATGVSVTDPLPANTTNLTVVSLPLVSIDASDTSQLSVSGITVPASSSVQVVFDVTVANAAPGTTIDNTATITNPDGPGGNPAAPTMVVLASQVAPPAEGSKFLYLLEDLLEDDSAHLTRDRDLTGTSTTPGVNISAGSTQTWSLGPELAADLTIDGDVSINLRAECSDGFWCDYVPGSITAELWYNGVQIGETSDSGVVNSESVTTIGLSIPITAPHTLVRVNGAALELRIQNSSFLSSVRVYEYNGGRSTVSFLTTTVINVDSVDIYSVPHAVGNEQEPQYVDGDTIYVRAVASDPFGSADITSATLELTDAQGNKVVDGAAMTVVASTDATKTFEYGYPVPANPLIGTWTAKVTAVEGRETDPVISHHGSQLLSVHGLVTLTKSWGGATDGHAVDLAISGGSSATAGSSTAPSTTSPATATAGPDATLTLSETFTNGSADSYGKVLACTKASDSSEVPVTGTGSSRTITMPGDSAVACVWTNTWMVPLTVVKLNAVVWDPVNEFNNPKAIPGALVEYQIIVTNPATGPIDADTIFVSDTLPAHIALRLDFDAPGSGPVSFTQGSTPSGLTYAFSSLDSDTDDVAFSDDDGATWGYDPMPDADGFDTAVDAIRINPKGIFNAKGPSDPQAPQFTLKFRVKVL